MPKKILFSLFCSAFALFVSTGCVIVKEYQPEKREDKLNPKEYDLARQLLQQMCVFCFRHFSGCPAMTVAKRAVHIANVGDFYINSGKHMRTSFCPLY